MNKRNTHKYRELTGGAFTGNQLYGLIRAIYKKDDSYLENKIDVIPLDMNNNLLYNDFFKVYFNPTNLRFIAIHRGTDINSSKDIINNIRNMFFVHTQSLITIRNQIAKSGHENLKKYLISLYKNKEHNIDKSKKNIIEYINSLLQPIDNQLTVSIEEAVEHLLKTNLSTIGDSQGAVYAYLYGNQGAETIVYNPAPYKGKKPDNTFIIKRNGDIVSMFTDNSDNSIVKIKKLKKLITEDINKKHKYNKLKGNKQKIRKKLILNHNKKLDKKEKTNKNKKTTKKNNRITKKQHKIEISKG